MKKYYNTLTKEKKIEIKKIYDQKYKDSRLEASLKRLRFYAYLGYLFGIIFLAYALKTNESKTSSNIISTILFIIGTGYVVGTIIIKNKVLNDLALKEKK